MVGEGHERRPWVAIVGAGFGGPAAARRLDSVDVDVVVDVVVVDAHNHHVFTPFLHQVSTALLPAPVAAPTGAGCAAPRHRRAHRPRDRHRPRATPGPYRQRQARLRLCRPRGWERVDNYFGNAGIAAHSLGVNDLTRRWPCATACRRSTSRPPGPTTTSSDAACSGVSWWAAGRRGSCSSRPGRAGGHAAASRLPSPRARRRGPHARGGIARAARCLRSGAPAASAAHARSSGIRVISGARVEGVHRRLHPSRRRTALPAATVVWAAGVTVAPLATQLSTGPARTRAGARHAPATRSPGGVHRR